MTDDAGVLIEAEYSLVAVSGSQLPTLAAALRQRGHYIGEALSHTPDDKLLPVDQAEALALEVERALEPAGKKTGAALARKLLGCYPALNAPDPRGYAEMLATELATLPADIAAEVVELVTSNMRWPPARADLIAVGRKLVARRRKMRDAIESHIEEQHRRAARREQQARLAKAREVAPDIEGLADRISEEWKMRRSEALSRILDQIDERSETDGYAKAVAAVVEPIREQLVEIAQHVARMLAEVRSMRSGRGRVGEPSPAVE